MMMNKQRQPNNDLMVYDGLDGSGWRGTLYKIDAFMVASKSSVQRRLKFFTKMYSARVCHIGTDRRK